MMNNKTTTETREAINNIDAHWYGACTDEKDWDDCYWNTTRNRILQLIAKEKKALLERVGREVIGENENEDVECHHGEIGHKDFTPEGCSCGLDEMARNEFREIERKRLQKLESEIGE